MRAVAENLLRDRVQSLHVGDRIHHHDVARPHIRPHVAGGDGRDHDLRHAERQRAHRLRRDRRAARAAGGNNAGDAALAADPVLEGFAHARDRAAAIAGEHAARAMPVIERDLGRRHIGRRRLAAGRQIHQPRADAALFQEIAQEPDLLALGVERAGDDHIRIAADGGVAQADDIARRFRLAADWRSTSARARLDQLDRRGLRPARRNGWVRLINAQRPGRRAAHRRRGVTVSGTSGMSAWPCRPTPSRRCCSSRSPASCADGMTRLIAAIDHDGHVLGDFRGHADILLDHQHGHLGLLRKPDQHVLDLRDDHRREPFRRLIHHKEARIEEERARDREHLLLAARQLPGAIALAFRKARECVVDALDRPQAALGRHEPQMLVDRERAPQPPPLRDIADADARDIGGRAADQFLAGDADRAARRPHQTHDRLAQSGLAHAVAADHRQHAALQGEIDALQCVRMPVMNIEARHFEHRG